MKYCYKAKFGAFNLMCTIISPSCQLATHPSPVGPEKWPFPGWISDGAIAKIDNHVKYYVHTKSGAFNPKCAV